MNNDAKGARVAIVDAFNRLVLSTRRLRPPVAQLLREASVARSTFYEHFDSRDTVLVEAMRGPLSVLAEAITSGDANRLTPLLEHFWENRPGAREMMSSTLVPRIVRALADLIEARAQGIERADAIRIADSQLGMIRLWINGETPSPARTLAEKMVASAAAQRAAFASGERN